MRDNLNNIPSTWSGGKASHDDDYMIGFVAGVRAFEKNRNASMLEGNRLFGRAKKRHGSWWLVGFGNGIDYARHGIKAPIAKKLGLV